MCKLAGLTLPRGGVDHSMWQEMGHSIAAVKHIDCYFFICTLLPIFMFPSFVPQPACAVKAACRCSFHVHFLKYQPNIFLIIIITTLSSLSSTKLLILVKTVSFPLTLGLIFPEQLPQSMLPTQCLVSMSCAALACLLPPKMFFHYPNTIFSNKVSYIYLVRIKLFSFYGNILCIVIKGRLAVAS